MAGSSSLLIKSAVIFFKSLAARARTNLIWGPLFQPCQLFDRDLGLYFLDLTPRVPVKTTSSNMLNVLEWKGDRVHAGGQKREHGSNNSAFHSCEHLPFQSWNGIHFSVLVPGRSPPRRLPDDQPSGRRWRA
ncbi:hypothetical protein C8F04DRAFT_709414 [Mycena alexandri]|uniref:Uncharacterized protein n=1 Tax=Mycena alexandri TaxID=1745969 RepID=A0AAD6X1B2_9AGAR|nr:hypothetical protein C8F04DRAFT_709414 [Mycena alexandri]